MENPTASSLPVTTKHQAILLDLRSKKEPSYMPSSPDTTNTKLIVQRIQELISNTNSLIESSIMDAAIDIAQDLGMGDVLDTTIDLILSFIDIILAGIEKIKNMCADIEPIEGLVGLVLPLSIGLGDSIKQIGNTLSDAEIGNIFQLPDQLEKGMDYTNNILDAGKNILASLPDKKDFEGKGNIFDRLGELKKILEGYKTPEPDTQGEPG